MCVCVWVDNGDDVANEDNDKTAGTITMTPEICLGDRWLYIDQVQHCHTTQNVNAVGAKRVHLFCNTSACATSLRNSLVVRLWLQNLSMGYMQCTQIYSSLWDMIACETCHGSWIAHQV